MTAKKPNFKAYHQDQMLLLPPSLDELVADGHPVRVVNEIIEKIDINALLGAYNIKGCSCYHPKMLLKVLVFGYMSNIYSSRKLESICKENICFMWLTGMNFPDHNTINRFRGVCFKEALRSVFEEVVKLLADEGLLSIDQIYTDGTKMEANANRYTFVWKKSIQTNKEKMKQQLEEIWNYAQNIASDEDNMPTPPDFTTLDAEKVQSAVDKLNEVLKPKKELDKKVRAKLRYITLNFPQNIVKYEKQEEILGE